MQEVAKSSIVSTFKCDLAQYFTLCKVNTNIITNYKYGYLIYIKQNYEFYIALILIIKIFSSIIIFINSLFKNIIELL